MDFANKFNKMTSNYVTVAIKLCLDVGNDYIILCNFGGHVMSGFKVIQGGGGGGIL